MPYDPSAGDVLLDRYELLEQIGSGGHGVVFRAKQLALDREVATSRKKTSEPERHRRSSSPQEFAPNFGLRHARN